MATSVKSASRLSVARRFHPILKKVHIYLGLLSMSIVLVWGIIGVYLMFAQSEEGRPKVAREWTISYSPPPNSTDRQVADAVYEIVKPPLSATVPDFALAHDPEGNLLLNYYSVNGILRVTVLEKQSTLRIQELRNNFGRFLNGLHTSTPNDRNTRWQMRVWTKYTEFSIWSLLAMSFTGALMWLFSRPGYRLAIISGALGAAAFVLLYVLVR